MACFLFFDDNSQQTITYNYTNNLWMNTISLNLSQNNDVRICPVAPASATVNTLGALFGVGTAHSAWQFNQDPSTTNIFYGGYCLNGWFYCNVDTSIVHSVDPSLLFNRMTAVSKPSSTPLFTDGVWVDAWVYASSAPAKNQMTGTDNGGLGRITIDRHGRASPAGAVTGYPLPGKINVAFADGHSELTRDNDVYSFYWNKDWRVPPFLPSPQ
jgi:prepilin-type processing-associated H-X9-DG protein